MKFSIILACLSAVTYAIPIVYIVHYKDGPARLTYRRESHMPDAYAAATVENMSTWSNSMFAGSYGEPGKVVVTYTQYAPNYDFAYHMSYEMSRVISRHMSPGSSS